MAWPAFIIALVVLVVVAAAMTGMLVRRLESSSSTGSQGDVDWPVPVLLLSVSLVTLAASLLLLWSLNLRGNLGV